MHPTPRFKPWRASASRINLTNPVEIRQAERDLPVTYYVFDLLYLDGVDVRRAPLEARRALLRRTKPERVAAVLTAGDIELNREKKRVARAGRDRARRLRERVARQVEAAERDHASARPGAPLEHAVVRHPVVGAAVRIVERERDRAGDAVRVEIVTRSLPSRERRLSRSTSGAKASARGRSRVTPSVVSSASAPALSWPASVSSSTGAAVRRSASPTLPSSPRGSSPRDGRGAGEAASADRAAVPGRLVDARDSCRSGT